MRAYLAKAKAELTKATKTLEEKQKALTAAEAAFQQGQKEKTDAITASSHADGQVNSQAEYVKQISGTGANKKQLVERLTAAVATQNHIVQLLEEKSKALHKQFDDKQKEVNSLKATIDKDTNCITKLQQGQAKFDNAV